jgi:hypothetical protein
MDGVHSDVWNAGSPISVLVTGVEPTRISAAKNALSNQRLEIDLFL